MGQAVGIVVGELLESVGRGVVDAHDVAPLTQMCQRFCDKPSEMK